MSVSWFDLSCFWQRGYVSKDLLTMFVCPLYNYLSGTEIQSTETICSCVCVQVSSLLWMRRERRRVLSLRPLCLGNMAAGAKLRGKKRISLSVTVDHLRAQQWYIMTPSLVWVTAVCVLCWSPEQQERADSPGPSCVSMKSDRSMSFPPNFKDGRPSREER